MTRRPFRRDGAPSGTGEPRMIEVKRRSFCGDCGTNLPSGARALWQPGTRTVYGEDCGCAFYRGETIDRARAAREPALLDEIPGAAL